MPQTSQNCTFVILASTYKYGNLSANNPSFVPVIALAIISSLAGYQPLAVEKSRFCAKAASFRSVCLIASIYIDIKVLWCLIFRISFWSIILRIRYWMYQIYPKRYIPFYIIAEIFGVLAPQRENFFFPTKFKLIRVNFRKFKHKTKPHYFNKLQVVFVIIWKCFCIWTTSVNRGISNMYAN